MSREEDLLDEMYESVLDRETELAVALTEEALHVGADNVGALIAEEPYDQDEIVLLVDVGTNAEIVLGNRNWMFSASSPTGPAFEGAQIVHGMRAAPGAIERVRIDPVTR